MLPKLLRHVSLFRVLHQIDQEFSQTCQQAGCPYCDGPLHKASYFRKPRGGPGNIPEEYQIRLSLCCGRESCRRRVLPPSCLFMGRKVYWRAVILIVTTLRQKKPSRASINLLVRKFSISRKTIVRWIKYFRAEFGSTSGWQSLRGLVTARISNDDLPGSLIDYFLHHHTCAAAGLIGCLRFLALST